MSDPVNPFAYFQGGYQMGNAIGNAFQVPGQIQQYNQQQAALQEQARLAEEQKAQLEAARSKAFGQDGTAQDRRSYISMLDPEKAKQLTDAMGNLDQAEANSLLQQTGSIVSLIRSGKIDDAKSAFETRAQGYENSGLADQAKFTRSIASTLDTNPKVAEEYLMTASAFVPGADKMFANLASKGGESRAQELQPLEVIMKNEEIANKQADTAYKQAQVDAMKAADKYRGEGKVEPDKIPDAENDLNDRYSKSVPVQNTLKMKTFYENIQNAENSSPGDIALVYNFMKMQDPGSTVMAGEQADAKNAGGVDAMFRNMYNNLLSTAGATIDKKVRDKFVSQAAKIYENNKKAALLVENSYRKIAERRGLNPDNLGFYDFEVAGVPSSGVASNPDVVTAPTVTVITPPKETTKPAGTITPKGNKKP